MRWLLTPQAPWWGMGSFPNRRPSEGLSFYLLIPSESQPR
jgi:hypothetical protein